MALSMIDKLANYLMPLEEVATKEQFIEEVTTLRSSKKTNLQVHTNPSVGLKMLIVTPAKYGDVRIYADHLKAKIALVINLTDVEAELQYAIKDFMDGVCYVMDGSSHRITDSIFLYVPTNVNVDKELYAYSVPAYVKPKNQSGKFL